jgi:asparagine synthase (glutamine-hydrolysing)
VAAFDPYETHLRYFRQVPALDFVDRMMYVDQHTFLPELNLTYSDKTSMAASIEARVPLLDQEVASFMRAVPARYKIHGLTLKYLFRRAMEGILPKDVIWRGKAGFGAPVRTWLRRELREMVDDLLSEQAIRRRGYFDATEVRGLIDRHQRQVEDHTYRVWAFLTLELWHRTFVDAGHQVKSWDATPARSGDDIGYLRGSPGRVNL